MEKHFLILNIYKIMMSTVINTFVSHVNYYVQFILIKTNTISREFQVETLVLLTQLTQQGIAMKIYLKHLKKISVS